MSWNTSVDYMDSEVPISNNRGIYTFVSTNLQNNTEVSKQGDSETS